MTRHIRGRTNGPPDYADQVRGVSCSPSDTRQQEDLLGWHPWFNTDIVFDLAEQGDRTIVRFDHSGWPEVSDLFRDCSMSWAYFLESLRSLLEEGRGTPESRAPACESDPAA
jgi:hypothetical protein